MGLAVVRCTTCHGASQVEWEALGLMVRCPRCDAMFIAIEEAEVPPPPRSPRNPTLPPSEPVREPRPKRSRRRPERERDSATRELETKPESDHDPHREPPGTLPASVLIGLALLPFAIPILWLVAPVVTGIPPAMSIATPLSLSLSASILCLAVIYTIDWTATTRIKGVLMLVGLSYFGALGLYFVKKELVERAKRFAGMDDHVHWRTYRTADYEISLPSHPRDVAPAKHPIQSIPLSCREADCEKVVLGPCNFTIGSGPLPNNAGDPRPGTEPWFKQVMAEIVTRSGGQQKREAVAIKHQDFFSGRQVEIGFPERGVVRIVRVYKVRATIYYLSVEGVGMHPGDDYARTFFNSFDVPQARH